MRIRVGVDSGDVVGSTNRELQIAADALLASGGGVLEIGPGRYEMFDALRLGSYTRVIGAGRRTVLARCPGAESPLAVDADYGELVITPRSLRGLRTGMGIIVEDDAGRFWHSTRSRILEIVPPRIVIADRLVSDYSVERNGFVRAAASVIEAVGVEDVVIEDLCVDGNGRSNGYLNGCRGGGIYLREAKRCSVRRCIVRDFNGDGISFQITEDVTVEGCRVEGVTGLGIHPGTGSARPAIRDCAMRDCGEDGLFLCWRVQDGLVEGCEMSRNGRHGISIGHKDTGNLFRRNLVRLNALAGVHFRDEKKSNAADGNRFEANVIEANGRRAPSPAVEILGETSGLVFEGNTIRAGRGPGQIVAFHLGPRCARPVLRRNRIGRHADGVVRRAGDPGTARRSASPAEKA